VIHRVTFKPSSRYWHFEHLSLAATTARKQMLQWSSEGITALEIFAPMDGGNSYPPLTRPEMDSGSKCEHADAEKRPGAILGTGELPP
jgi:hypothetical protein